MVMAARQLRGELLMNAQKPRVFIVQDDPGKNFLPAQHYGELVPLLDARDEAGVVNLGTIFDKLQEGLADVTPDDLLVCVGNPVSIGMACAIVSRLTGGLNLLKWDTQERRYWRAQVQLGQLP